MKKIFHFVKSNNLSGLENIVINICTMVKGYEFIYVSKSGPINKLLDKYGIKHIIVPKISPVTILSIIKKYEPDVVQAHDPLVSVLMAFSYPFCKRHHIRMISELHNTDPKMKDGWRPRSIGYLLSSFFYNDIIAVSNKVIDNYVYGKFLKNKVTVIPNVINPFRIKKMLSPNIKNKKWDCMFLGRMTDQKDPLRFIKIIYKLKKRKNDIKAVIVGDGDLFDSATTLSNKLGLGSNIDFVGFQSNPYKYLQLSKVIVITSKYEGFCLVALESLIVGDPVVLTPLTVLKQLLGQKYDNFELTNKDFVNKIFDLLKNKNDYEHYKLMGFSRIRKLNDVNKFIKGYRSIYNKN